VLPYSALGFEALLLARLADPDEVIFSLSVFRHRTSTPAT
jgi:hypothetical protein